MRIAKAALCLLAFTMFAATLVPTARADGWDKKTVVTFSQSVELPGIVLPAGTYTFKLSGSAADRNVLQVFSADGTKLLATILAINNWRLKPTGQTVMKFNETQGDTPVALRAWFYPGDNFGQEFVYPKVRARELAQNTAVIVPALAVDTIDVSKIASLPLIAITPDQKEVELTTVIQTTPPADAVVPPATVEVAPVAVAPVTITPVVQTQELPKTGSSMPLVALLGVMAISIAFGIKLLLKHSS
jgi:LPXTG-motif cell wall-anchored protein